MLILNYENNNDLYFILLRHGEVKSKKKCQAIPRGKIKHNLEKKQVTVYDFNIRKNLITSS